MFPDFRQSNGSGVDPDDALESRKIPLQSIIPDGVITAGDAKNVRFDFSKKNGYSPKQVDKYVFEVVSQSLEFYQRTLEGRDRDVHRLGKDLNDAEVDNQRLKRQLEFADSNAIIADSISRAKSDPEFQALMDELDVLRSQVAAYQAENPEAVHPQGDSISDDQLASLNETIAGYQAALEAHEQNVAYYEGQIETLTNERDEYAGQVQGLVEERDGYATQATQYYEQAVALQAKMDNFSEDQSTALYTTSQALGKELEELKVAKAELDSSYAIVYAELETLKADIPESGIVSHDDYATLQVQYDSLNTKLSDTEEREKELLEEIDSLKKGTLAGSGAITEEDYNALVEKGEQLTKEARSLEAKYGILLGQKQAQDEMIENLKAQVGSAPVGESTDIPDGYVSQADYEALHAQASETIDMYNTLTEEYNELYSQYEAFAAQVSAAGQEVHQTPVTEAPVDAQPVYEEQTQYVEEVAEVPQPQNTEFAGSRYQNKKLPEGIRLEDLE